MEYFFNPTKLHRYGRRPVIMATILLGTFFGIIQSLSTSYTMFAAMEFITALASSGTYMSIFVIAVEYAGPNQRVLSSSLISIVYAASQVLAGVLAMYFRNFRTLLQVLYGPNCLVILYYWFIPESTRWLLTKGHLKRARKIIVREAKINGVTLSADTVNTLTNCHRENNTSTESVDIGDHTAERRRNPFILAIKSKLLLLRLVNCLYCWATNAFIYYGLNVNSVSLAGNKYTNYIYMNLVEVPAAFGAYYLIDKLGRKRTLSFCLLVSGIACAVSQLVSNDTQALILFIVGKFAVTISYTILYLFTSELFPTNVRHSFMNACSTFGSFGSMIAAQTPLLVRECMVAMSLNYINIIFADSLLDSIAVIAVWRIGNFVRFACAVVAGNVQDEIA